MAGDWRGTRSRGSAAGPKRTAATKWTRAALVSGLMLVVAGVAIWLVLQFVRPTNPNAYFVPFWMSTYQSRLGIPTVPWTRADREAFVGDKAALFSTIDRKEASDQPLETVKERLDGLRDRADDDAVVVYISAYAVVDTDGKIRIMAKDSRPYEPDTQLPLGTVLEAIQRCKSKNKLLVLDIMRNMLDPRDLGATADGVGDLVRKELQNGKNPDVLNDPDLTVFCACSPGEYSLGSENLGAGRSAFSFFFERALTTTEADTDRDNLIDVAELQKYVSRNVDDWALRYRGVHQVPYLAGAPNPTFRLRAVQATSTSSGDSTDDGMPEIEEKTKGEPSEPSASKEKAKEAEKATTKEADEPPTSSRRREYPVWLAAGWDTHQDWWKSGDYRAAPRVFRRLGAMLLRAERRWRGGDKEGDVQEELAIELKDRLAEMKRAKDISLPIPRSAGLAVALGRQPDAVLKAAIEDALAKWREINPNDPKAQDQRTGIEKGLVALFKGKTPVEFALALVAASQKRELDRPSLLFFDSIVDQSRTIFQDKDPRGQVVELRFLHQLAERVKALPPNDWWEKTDEAWKTVFNAEQASYQPRSLSWVRATLVKADASLHDAQVLLLTEPKGYASWKPQIDDAWEKASTLYQSLRARQDAIQSGQDTFAKSLTVLSFLVPCLEAKADPELQQDWVDAAKSAREMAILLDPPLESETTPEQIDTRIAKLSGESEKLDGKCKSLLSRFEPATLKSLVAACQSDTVAPDPKRINEIEAILATPFPSSSDRRVLRDAERSLEARLKHSKDTSVATSEIGNSDPPRTRVKNRFDRIVEFLKLCGSETTEPKLSWSNSDVDKVWRAMAEFARAAYGSFDDRLRNSKLIDDIDPAGLLAPVYALRLADANATGGEDNPCRAARERDSLRACSWLAARYRHQSLDLPDLADADKFYEGAATNSSAEGDFTPEVYPRIQVLDVKGRPVTEKDPVKLTTENRRGEVNIGLKLDNTDAANAANAAKTELSVIQSADSRLRVTSVPKELSLSAESSPLNIQFELSTDGNGSRTAPPSEFFLALKMENGRKYHARVPIKIVTGELVPRLVLSSDPATLKKVPDDKIRLRPIAGLRQPYYVFVDNRTDKAVDVTVAVMEGSTIKARGGTKEAPIKVKAGSLAPVGSFVGGPLPKEGDPLTKLVEPIQLQLRDAVTDDLIQELAPPVIVASPRDYVQVTSVEFIPERLTDPNRLTVVLNPLPGLGDRPCPVELVLPADKTLFPAFKGEPKEGTLAGFVETGGNALILNAQRIPLDSNVDDTLPSYFFLNVDGIDKADAIKRAFWFKTTFRQEGNQQLVTPDTTARVRFAAERLYPKGSPAKLLVHFAVDNPPPKAKLTFKLFRDDGGQNNPEPIISWSDQPTDKRLGFDVKGDTGALLFEASERDWDREFKVPGIHGTCRLEARLVDLTSGRDIADPYRISMELDDRPAQNMGLEVRPEKVERGTPEVLVVASLTPPPTMREVTFIAGTKKVTEAEFDKAEQDGKTVKGVPVGNDGRSWKATIKVPADVADKLLITARFKPVAGLTELFFTDVPVVDPPPTAKDKAKAAMEPPKPGSIEGTVTIAGRPQPDLVVVLYYYNPMTKMFEEIDKKTTTEKGTYKFTEVPPKNYTVFCYKMSDGRKATEATVVKPGETNTVDLKMVQ